MQISDAWLLYKSNTLGEGFLSATLKVFTVIDDREGTEQEFKLVIGKLESVGSSPLHTVTYDENQRVVDVTVFGENDVKPVPTMLILDAKFSKLSTFVSLCVQRPQMLVALDFLLAVVEFFVPSAGNMLSNEEDKNSIHVIDAIILDQSTFKQPSAEFSLSPQRPLIVDDERFDHFIYDGNGGVLFLKDRRGYNLEASNTEAIIYVGSGKKLQFKNVVIKVLDFTYIFYLFTVSLNIDSSICLPRTLTTSIIWLV
jgi:vacuolar protein sorting-associated protein 13A/C